MKNHSLTLYRMKKFYSLISLLVILFVTTSCETSDEPQDKTPKEVWGETYSHTNLGAYPDLYSNYWIYVLETNKNPNIGLRITGKFPQTRFFSFSVYNEMNGEVIDGLNDNKITPDEGCVNPYCVTTDRDDNTFTLYLLKENTDISILKGVNNNNIIYYKSDLQRISICLRHYLGIDEYGGVELPKIEAINLTTGQNTTVPENIVSNAVIMSGDYEPLDSDTNTTVPFFLAPRGQFFPNSSTEYLYCRTQVTTDQVFLFSFIPVPLPTCVEEYENAKARYWSICLGSVRNTRSYYSFYDKKIQYPEGEKITVVVCSKNNPQIDAIRELAEGIRYSYLIEWDETMKDHENKPIGDVMTILYRNILPDKTWEYSMANLTPVPYGDPYNSVTDPENQYAHMALGDYGPLGIKYTTQQFLELRNAQ